jgi:hypothetical protein
MKERGCVKMAVLWWWDSGMDQILEFNLIDLVHIVLVAGSGETT